MEVDEVEDDRMGVTTTQIETPLSFYDELFGARRTGSVKRSLQFCEREGDVQTCV